MVFSFFKQIPTRVSIPRINYDFFYYKHLNAIWQISPKNYTMVIMGCI